MQTDNVNTTGMTNPQPQPYTGMANPQPQPYTEEELKTSVIDPLLHDSNFLNEHVRVHFIGLKKYKRTIRGKRFVNWMMDHGKPRDCNSMGQAIDVCTELMRYQLIEHVKETRRNRAYFLEEIYQFSDKALGIHTTNPKEAHAQRREILTRGISSPDKAGDNYLDVLEASASSHSLAPSAFLDVSDDDKSDYGDSFAATSENEVDIRQLLEQTQRLSLDVHDLKNRDQIPMTNSRQEEFDLLLKRCNTLQLQIGHALEEMWTKLIVTVVVTLLLTHYGHTETAVMFIVGVISGCVFLETEQPWRPFQRRMFVRGDSDDDEDLSSSLVPVEMLTMMEPLSPIPLPAASAPTEDQQPLSESKQNTAETQTAAATPAIPAAPQTQHRPEFVRDMLEARDFFTKIQMEDPGKLPLVHPIYPGVDANNKGGNCWSQPEARTFNVRGKMYLSDGRKVKSHPALFSTLAMEISHLDDKVDHVASRDTSARAKYHQTLADAGQPIPERCGQAGFLFIISFLAPGYMCTIYFKRREPKISNFSEVFERNLAAFCDGHTDKKYRDKRLKIIPRVMEGGFVVRKAVGGKPGILANFMKTEYYTGPGYLEVDIDISSSGLAKRVMGVVRKVARQIVIDLGFTIQGNSSHMLPEVMLGSVRLHKVQTGKLPQFDAV